MQKTVFFLLKFVTISSHARTGYL